MLDSVFVQPSVVNRLRCTPVGAYLDELVTILHQQGYARDSIRGYLRACAQFGQWLGQQGYHVSEVDETLIQQYRSGLHHSREGRQPKGAEGLPHLLRLLRQQAIVPTPTSRPPSTAADQWLKRYEHYLEHILGATLRTRQRYLPLAKRFLEACLQSGQWEWSSLRAQEITEFVRQQATSRTGQVSERSRRFSRIRVVFPAVRTRTATVAAVALTAVALALAVVFGGSESSDTAKAESASAPGAPTVEIISPRNGARQVNHAVVAKVSVENFQLAPRHPLQ